MDFCIAMEYSPIFTMITISCFTNSFMSKWQLKNFHSYFTQLQNNLINQHVLLFDLKVVLVVHCIFIMLQKKLKESSLFSPEFL